MNPWLRDAVISFLFGISVMLLLLQIMHIGKICTDCELQCIKKISSSPPLPLHQQPCHEETPVVSMALITDITFNASIHELCYRYNSTLSCFYECQPVVVPAWVYAVGLFKSENWTLPYCIRFKNTPSNNTLTEQCYMDSEAALLKNHCTRLHKMKIK